MLFPVYFAAKLVCAGFDLVAAYVFRTKLSVVGVVWSLFDLRGMWIRRTLPISASEFENTTAVIVGNFGGISLGVASSIARHGADAIHLVSASSRRLWNTVGVLRQEPHACAITPHTVDFSNPGKVVEWCRDMCMIARGRGQQIGVLVLGSVLATPEEQRFTREALDQAFAADVIALQAILAGLRPVLAPNARVVISASAACRWLSKMSCEAITAVDVCWLSAFQARAQQQAARVVLAGHQARKWAAEQEGPVCVVCTPSVGCSAWTDLLAWAGFLDTSRLIGQGLSCPRRLKTSTQSRMANSIVRLCSSSVQVSPGEYYWGWCRVSNLCDASCEVADDAIGKMLVMLALRSGQLPG